MAQTNYNPDGSVRNVVGQTSPPLSSTTPQATPPSPSGVDDMTFLGMMNKLNTSFQQTNTLIDQKNALVHASMGNPIDTSKLPPDVQSVIQSGNRDAMRLFAQSLNDQINNNSSSVASSIQYLTAGYQNAVKTANDQKQAELDNLVKLASTFVGPDGKVDIQKAGAAFQALYPGVDISGILTQLQGMMPVSEYNKMFYQGQFGGGLGNPLSSGISPSGNMTLDQAVVAQESGGSYTAVNKDSGALGKYQIMPFHLADLTNPNTGKPLDPNNPADRQLFIDTPALQDQLYSQIMSGLSQQYGGNEDKILAAYYGGAGAAEVVGTPAGDKPQPGGYPSINEYVAQIKSKMAEAALNPTGDASTAITAVTGLDAQTFNFATQGVTALSRMPNVQRQQVMNAWTKYANTHGVDMSTFQSQYKAYNDTLTSNISRFNNTQIAEGEVKGTLQNLNTQAIQSGLTSVNLANVAAILAGQNVNDPSANAYAFYLQDLRNSLSYFYAAQQGKSSPDVNDNKDAAAVIVQGLSSGGIQGLLDATEQTTAKMKVVLQQAVDNARQQVWSLFGVGDKYQSSTPQASAQSGGVGGGVNDPLGLGI